MHFISSSLSHMPAIHDATEITALIGIKLCSVEIQRTLSPLLTRYTGESLPTASSNVDHGSL